MKTTITLLDPALENHRGYLSNNLGDIIISESVISIIKSIFPAAEIIRISTHDYLESRHRNIINDSKYTFIGGSNLLSSDIKSYNQWKVSNNSWYYYYPKLKNIILLGVGWWQYQHKPTFTSNFFYNSVLSHKLLHSVRDKYTYSKMQEMGFDNVLNTSCITSWSLNAKDVNKKNKRISTCLFTLTDYNQVPELDNRLINILLEYYNNGLFFFPQGKYDEEYLKSLSSYKRNNSQIKIISRSNLAFDEMLNNEVDYIGTRLHGGIRGLQKNVNALIIGVDNRALEIHKDINLPVIRRDNLDAVKLWIQGEKIFSPISLPLEAIDKWKTQFNNN